MTMTRSQILAFASQNPVCFLATCCDNTPFCRAMMVAQTDSDGILFSTDRSKQLFLQLEKNPSVEICFYSQQQNKQLRINSQVEFTQDMELKKKLVDKYPFLASTVAEHGYDALTPFYIKKGAVCTWIAANDKTPKECFDF